MSRNLRKTLLFRATSFSVPFALALATTAAAQQSTELFADNFNLENMGNGATVYNSFFHWNVTAGSVDLIGNGFFDFYPNHGLYVDLDGTTMAGGTLESVRTFTLRPGNTYFLHYKLGGSARGDVNTVQVKLGNAWQVSRTLSSDVGLLSFFDPVMVDTTTQAKISFTNLGGDDIGAILDDVRLTEEPSTFCTITPETTELPVGSVHEFEVEVFAEGHAPGTNTFLEISIDTGPNSEMIFRTKYLGRDGVAAISYRGTGGTGTDSIAVTTDVDGQPLRCFAQVEWIEPSVCLLDGSGTIFLKIDSGTNSFSWNDCTQNPDLFLEGTGQFQTGPPQRPPHSVLLHEPLLYEGMIDGNLGVLDANISRRSAILRTMSSDTPVRRIRGGFLLNFNDPRCGCP